jgi:hypothetical protein
MPRRAHDPAVIQSSKLNWPKAYLMRKVRLPFNELPVSCLARDVRGDAKGDEVRQVAVMLI